MNGTQDLLTGGSEFSKESNDVVGGLTIKTGSGLVEEKQEIRLGGEFDTDSDSLSCFDRQTVAAAMLADAILRELNAYGKPIMASANSCNSSNSIMSSQ